MKKYGKFRLFWVVPGSLALTLALGRCSPIAPSIDKHSLISQANPSASIMAGGSPMGQPLSTAKVHVLLYKVRVLDGEAYREAVVRVEESKASNPGNVLYRMEEAQLSELKKIRKARLQLAGMAPNEATAFIGVSLPKRVLEENDVSGLETSFRPSSESGEWILSFPTSSDPERERIAQLVLGNLEAVSLQLIDPSLVLPVPTSSGTPIGATGATGATGFVRR